MMAVMEKNCAHCDGIFAKKPSTSVRAWGSVRYCSKGCYTAAQKGVDAFVASRYRGVPHNKGKTGPSGPENPNWRGGGLHAKCRNCGTDFHFERYRAAKAKFCSKRCSEQYRDEGKTGEHRRIRDSAAYAEWRRAVFQRDDYTCVMCGERGGSLHADHIKRFADYADLRLDLGNGRTLCESCHRTTPTYGNRAGCVGSAQET
jgi:hypothetical protein